MCHRADYRVIRGSTNSVRSSVFDFVEENGRTFHRYKEGSKFEFSILFSVMCESRSADEPVIERICAP